MNAAKVIKDRGIKAIKAHMQALSAAVFKPKMKQVVRVRRAAKPSTVGQVLSEPAAEKLQPTLVKSMSDAANDPFVQSAKRLRRKKLPPSSKGRCWVIHIRAIRS